MKVDTGDVQPAAPVFPLPIRRELLEVIAWFEDDELVVQLTCDCAGVTAVRMAAENHDGSEIAISCGSCQTPHWITIRRTAQ